MDKIDFMHNLGRLLIGNHWFIGVMYLGEVPPMFFFLGRFCPITVLKLFFIYSRDVFNTYMNVYRVRERGSSGVYLFTAIGWI